MCLRREREAVRWTQRGEKKKWRERIRAGMKLRSGTEAGQWSRLLVTSVRGVGVEGKEVVGTCRHHSSHSPPLLPACLHKADVQPWLLLERDTGRERERKRCLLLGVILGRVRACFSLNTGTNSCDSNHCDDVGDQSG